MAWTAPATFTDGAVLTAAQLNAMRDNFNETAPAKATTAGSYFVATGLNAIAQRTSGRSFLTGTGTTTSTSYGDLSGATIGPAVTVTSGTTALVSFAAYMSASVSDRSVIVSYAVSGATTVAALDDWALVVDGLPAGNPVRMGVTHISTGLTSGSNTFTLKYRVASAVTGTYANRHLAVLPF